MQSIKTNAYVELQSTTIIKNIEALAFIRAVENRQFYNAYMNDK